MQRLDAKVLSSVASALPMAVAVAPAPAPAPALLLLRPKGHRHAGRQGFDLLLRWEID